MNCKTHFEIHFHSEYRASAFLESEAGEEDFDFCQLLLFCQFAARQMHNLKSNRVSIATAQILSMMGTGGGSYEDYWQLMINLKDEKDVVYYLPLLAALEIDISKLVGFIPSLAIYRAVKKVSNEDLAQQICPQVAKIEQYTGTTGGKRFVADIELREQRTVDFKMEPKGFGFLAQGVNYYAPMSVILTFKYLKSLHDDYEDKNIHFRKALTKVANRCGEAFLQGKITSLSQVTLPLEITNLAFTETE